MKLLRPLVALALVVSVLGRISGSKWLRRHRPTAALLGRASGLKQAPPVSLDAATDKLQGVLDKVSENINQVLGGYTQVKDACVAEAKASAQRVETQSVFIADLDTSRSVNIERTAGLEASLANLVGQETDAHASYESSVSQRATALQKHLSTHKATVDQANAIGEVLEMMKQKRDMVTASQTDMGDNKANAPVAHASSGSALDMVIGVLTNIQDSGNGKAEDAATKHNVDDADLERLVTSYKTSLQHIDKQYQTENARRMEAKVTARDAGEEKTLRKAFIVDGEEKFNKEYFGLCGAGGKGGSVPKAIEAADWLLSQFKGKTQTALNVMDTLPDLVGGAASFLTVAGSQPVVAEARSEVLTYTEEAKTRRATVPASVQPAMASSDAESAQESAARWVMQMAAKMPKDNATQQLAKAVTASFPNGVPQRKPRPARAVVPSNQLHTLVGTGRSYQNMTARLPQGDDKASKQSAAIMACVTDKQDLTDKIIAARKEARVQRTDRMSAEARVKAVKSWRMILKDQGKVWTSSEKDVEKGFKALSDLIAKKTFTADLTDAVSEIGSIEADVDAYIKAGGPPASAGLPSSLKGIRESLTEVKTRLDNDMNALNSVWTGTLMLWYPAWINKLTGKDTDLNSEGEAVADAVKIADDAAKAQEQLEKDTMIERSGVEYRCLHEGTCGMLHYQQCCSGSGSFMKKVSTWQECADHCEALVKEGKAIAGCELTGLYKEDDRSGSGTCYAQTECSLKFAGEESKCAGSLCKALPAKA